MDLDYIDQLVGKNVRGRVVGRSQRGKDFPEDVAKVVSVRDVRLGNVAVQFEDGTRGMMLYPVEEVLK